MVNAGRTWRFNIFALVFAAWSLVGAVACQVVIPKQEPGGLTHKSDSGLQFTIVAPPIFQGFIIKHTSLWLAHNQGTNSGGLTTANVEPSIAPHVGFYIYRVVVTNTSDNAILLHPKGSKLLPELSVPDNITGKLTPVDTSVFWAYLCCDANAYMADFTGPSPQPDGYYRIAPGETLVRDLVYQYSNTRTATELQIFRGAPGGVVPWFRVPLPKNRFRGYTYEQVTGGAPKPESLMLETVPSNDPPGETPDPTGKESSAKEGESKQPAPDNKGEAPKGG